MVQSTAMPQYAAATRAMPAPAAYPTAIAAYPSAYGTGVTANMFADSGFAFTAAPAVAAPALDYSGSALYSGMGNAVYASPSGARPELTTQPVTSAPMQM